MNFILFQIASGIGDLIIDLDADIEKSSEVESSSLISPLNISHTRTNQSFLSKEIEESDELINMSSIGNSNKNLSKMDHQVIKLSNHFVKVV